MSNSSKGILLSSIALAITSSLCCIMPLLAIIGGVGGMATSLSWVAPIRPYLIVATVIVLGFAFYQAYKPVKTDNCGCTTEKKKFLQSKKFLWIVTIISIVLITFPYYSKIFYPVSKKETVVASSNDIRELSFKVEGMSCKSCEDHVNGVLLKQSGVIESKTSYENGLAVVKFDQSKTSLQFLMRTVSDETGYKTKQ